jgi:hypothetical protein
MGGKTPKPPPVPAPAPQAIPEVGKETEDMAMKKARAMSGYNKTLLTGSLVPQSKGLKSTLG